MSFYVSYFFFSSLFFSSIITFVIFSSTSQKKNHVFLWFIIASIIIIKISFRIAASWSTQTVIICNIRHKEKSYQFCNNSFTRFLNHFLFFIILPLFSLFSLELLLIVREKEEKRGTMKERHIKKGRKKREENGERWDDKKRGKEEK